MKDKLATGVKSGGQESTAEANNPYAPLLDRLSSFTGAGDNISTYFGNKIPKDKRGRAVAAHDFPDKKIFFLFDSTFWGGAENGVIMGKTGISLKYRDEDEPMLFTWQSVDDIAIQQVDGEVLLSFESEGWIWRACVGNIERRPLPELNECLKSLTEIEQSDFARTYAEISTASRTLPAVVAAATESDQKNALKCVERIDELMVDSGFAPDKSVELVRADALELCEGRLNAYPYFAGVLLLERAWMTAFSNEVESRRQIDEISEVLRNCINSGETDYLHSLCVSHSVSHLARRMAEQAPQPDTREAALRLLRENGSDADRKLANRLMAATDETRRDEYLQLSREQRRTILCTTKLPSWPTDEIRPIAPALIEKIGWTFPVGHPQSECVYVAHPLFDNVYLPIEDFHHRIFQERFRELQRLLSSLGASEIKIHSGEGLVAEMLREETISVSGKDSIITGSSIEGELDVRNKNTSRSSRSASVSLKLIPSSTKSVPKDLFWFKHEPTWQAIADEVMQGRVQEYSLELKYSADYSINEKLAVRLNTEIELFKGKVKASIDTEFDSFLRELRRSSTRIDVTFAEVPNQVPESAKYVQLVQPSVAGSEYMQDIVDLMEGGELPEAATRLLKRSQSRLGLSDDEAKQLEVQALARHTMTTVEQEYASTVADGLDGNSISNGARRLLQRTRIRLGISEHRAAEIETLVCRANLNASS